ncbi:CREB-binding protein [Lamellibrachia satsuma]|nr:CREB-binding protein [Lamellibrachia satsuma]
MVVVVLLLLTADDSSRKCGLLSDRYVYCERCFNDIKGDEVELADDPTQPPTKIRKEEFVKLKNNELESEPFVECGDCGRKLHQICVLHLDTIWSNGFVCDNCLKAKGAKRKENKYVAKRLPITKLGTYLENRINSFLKKKDAGAGEVTIRVLASSDKIVEVKSGMKTRRLPLDVILCRRITLVCPPCLRSWWPFSSNAGAR